MKRHAGLLLVLTLMISGLIAISGTTTANAYGSCRTTESGHFWTRHCAYDQSRGAGTIEGLTSWTYPLGGQGNNGLVNIYVDDRASAGCTVLRIRYRGGTRANETFVRRACGGKATNVVRHLNTQYLPYADGVFAVDWCESNTSKSKLLRCITIWSQRVGVKKP